MTKSLQNSGWSNKMYWDCINTIFSICTGAGFHFVAPIEPERTLFIWSEPKVVVLLFSFILTCLFGSCSLEHSQCRVCVLSRLLTSYPPITAHQTVMCCHGRPSSEERERHTKRHRIVLLILKTKLEMCNKMAFQCSSCFCFFLFVWYRTLSCYTWHEVFVIQCLRLHTRNNAVLELF